MPFRSFGKFHNFLSFTYPVSYITSAESKIHIAMFCICDIIVPMKRAFLFLSIIIVFILMTACQRDSAAIATLPSASAPVTDSSAPESTDYEYVHFAVSTPEELTPTETPRPVPVSVSPSASATAAPTETPFVQQEAIHSEAPADLVVFLESSDFPLPSTETQIQRKRPFWIDGTIRSTSPITEVRVQIVDNHGNLRSEADKHFLTDENILTYQLLDLTFSSDIDGISENIKFQDLPVGTYSLLIHAAVNDGDAKLLSESQFRITDEYWIQLQPNSLRGNYSTALAFFGSPERFLFRYRFNKSSPIITVDSDWISQYVAQATCLNGKKWTVHVDAVPYFEQACKYLESTYVRVSSSKHDSGPFCLADLVLKMDGTMIRRFTNSKEFISHHSFGTAVDINAHYPSQKDKIANREQIYKEVHDNLIYNGIIEIKGKQCYDFTYLGNGRRLIHDVPEPIVNYLLYELAFYRAGFSWGAYYPHTCDAMHFTLSELSPALFTDGPYAMRKVFDYVDDVDSAP